MLDSAWRDVSVRFERRISPKWVLASASVIKEFTKFSDVTFALVVNALSTAARSASVAARHKGLPDAE